MWRSQPGGGRGVGQAGANHLAVPATAEPQQVSVSHRCHDTAGRSQEHLGLELLCGQAATDLARCPRVQATPMVAGAEAEDGLGILRAPSTAESGVDRCEVAHPRASLSLRSLSYQTPSLGAGMGGDSRWDQAGLGGGHRRRAPRQMPPQTLAGRCVDSGLLPWPQPQRGPSGHSSFSSP